MTTASWRARSSSASTSTPDVDAVLELARPRRSSWSSRRSTTHFSILKSRHAEADQPAAGLVALVDRDRVAGAAQLLRGGQAGRAGADHRDGAAGLDRGRLRHDPALVPRAVDDRDLDLLDRDRVALADLQHARGLARRGAQPAGELREVVGRVQLVDRLAPAVAVDEVVPVRDQVARAGSRCGRTARRTPCSARPARAGPATGSVSTNSWKSASRSLGSRSGLLDPLDLEEAADLAHQALALRRRRTLRRRSTPRPRRLAASSRQRALVVVRHDLLEAAAASRPSSRRIRAATGEPRAQVVLLDQLVQLDRVGLVDLVEADQPMLQRSPNVPSSSST